MAGVADLWLPLVSQAPSVAARAPPFSLTTVHPANGPPRLLFTAALPPHASTVFVACSVDPAALQLRVQYSTALALPRGQAPQREQCVYDGVGVSHVLVPGLDSFRMIVPALLHDAPRAGTVLSAQRLTTRSLDDAVADLAALLDGLARLRPCSGLFTSKTDAERRQILFADEENPNNVDVAALVDSIGAGKQQHDGGGARRRLSPYFVARVRTSSDNDDRARGVPVIHERACAGFVVGRATFRCNACAGPSSNNVRVFRRAVAAVRRRNARRNVAEHEEAVDLPPRTALPRIIDMDALVAFVESGKATAGARSEAALAARLRAAAAVDDPLVQPAQREELERLARETVADARSTTIGLVLLDTLQRLATRGVRSTRAYATELLELGRTMLAGASGTHYERARQHLPFFLPSLSTLYRHERLNYANASAEELQFFLHSLMRSLSDSARVYAEQQRARGCDFPDDAAVDLVKSFVILSHDEMTASRTPVAAQVGGRARGYLASIGAIRPVEQLLVTKRAFDDGVLRDRVATSFITFTLRTLFTGWRAVVASFPFSGPATSADIMLKRARVLAILGACGFDVFTVVSDAGTPVQAMVRSDDVDGLEIHDLINAKCEFDAEASAIASGLAPLVYQNADDKGVVLVGRRYRHVGGGRTAGKQPRYAVDPASRPIRRPQLDERAALRQAVLASAKVEDQFTDPANHFDAQHLAKTWNSHMRKGFFVADSEFMTQARAARALAELDADAFDGAAAAAAASDGDGDVVDHRDGDNDDDDDDDDDHDDDAAADDGDDGARSTVDGGNTSSSSSESEMAAADEDVVRDAHAARRSTVAAALKAGKGGLLVMLQLTELAEKWAGGTAATTGAALAPIDKGLYDSRVSGAGLAPREVSLMAMDVKLARKVLSPQLLRFLDSFISGFGEEDFADEDREARTVEYATLRDFLSNMAPALHVITGNEFLTLAALQNKVQPHVQQALDFLARTSLKAGFVQMLLDVFDMWQRKLPQAFARARARLLQRGVDVDAATPLRLRPLRLTTDFLEAMHGQFRQSGSTRTATLPAVAGAAKKFNRSNNPIRLRSKAMRQSLSSSNKRRKRHDRSNAESEAARMRDRD